MTVRRQGFRYIEGLIRERVGLIVLKFMLLR